MNRAELEDMREAIDDQMAEQEQAVIDSIMSMMLTNKERLLMLMGYGLTSIAIELRFMNDNSVNRR